MNDVPTPEDKRTAMVAASTMSVRSQSFRLLNRQASFHMQRNIHELVQEYARDKNPDAIRDRVPQAVNADFPIIHRFPGPEDMDNSILHNPLEQKTKFDQGQFCEFLGFDMKWHLAQVERVIRVPRESWDPNSQKKPEFDYKFQFVGGTIRGERDVRASEEGLKRVFGLRPWLWQQWAILKTEEFCRFQELHERDFEMMSFSLSAHVLFDKWLNHPSNGEFKALYTSRPREEREKLKHHLSTPFILMDELSQRDVPGGEWSFKDANVSIYSYLSVLGAGWVPALAVLGLQLLIPAMLLYSAIVRSPRVDTANGSDFDQFCTKEGPIDGLIVNLCVIIFYAIRQVPMVVYTFFETAGEADTARSRLTSLRNLVWERGRDTIAMQIGHKVDKYMNSTYIALVNNVMLFVLFLQNDPSEIILNAISVEFVVYFAQEVANAIWLDSQTRYLRAGAVGLVMQSIVGQRTLSNSKSLCRKYDIDYNKFIESIKDDGFDVHCGVKNSTLAQLDKLKPEYNTPKDFVWNLAEKYAKTARNKVAMWVFSENIKYFDSFAHWLALVGINRPSIFRRYTSYCTWSRWEKLLFLSPCSKVERDSDGSGYTVIAEYLPPSLASVKEEMATSKRWIRVPYLNESSEIEKDVATRFIINIVKTLTFQYYLRSLRNAVLEKSLPILVFKLIDGIFEWVAYFYLVIFPFTLIGYIVLLLNCY